MRDTTERPEGIAAGTLKLVGTEEENIYTNFKLLLEDETEYSKMSKQVIHMEMEKLVSVLLISFWKDYHNG